MKVKKILVSQPKPESGKSPFIDLTEKFNVKVDFRPFIKVDPILSREFRDQKVNIADHSAIIFTSRSGIEHFFRLAKDLRVPISNELKYFCVSEAIALYLQKFILNFRKRKVFYGSTGRLQDMFTVLKKHTKENFLVVLPDNNNDIILDMLSKSNLEYDIALMYRTVSNDFEEGEEFNHDMVLFYSPQGISALIKNFPDFEQGERVIGTLGAATAQAAEEAGLRVDIKVPSPQYTSISVAVEAFIKENHKRR